MYCRVLSSIPWLLPNRCWSIPRGGTISNASGHCQMFPGGESQLVENHRPKEFNLDRGLGRKKEFCFRSVDALF